MRKLISNAVYGRGYHDINFRDDLVKERVINAVHQAMSKYAEDNGIKLRNIKHVEVKEINVGGSEIDWINESPVGRSITSPAIEMILDVDVKTGGIFRKGYETHSVNVSAEYFRSNEVVAKEIEHPIGSTVLFM